MFNYFIRETEKKFFREESCSSLWAAVILDGLVHMARDEPGFVSAKRRGRTFSSGGTEHRSRDIDIYKEAPRGKNQLSSVFLREPNTKPCTYLLSINIC